MTTPAQARLGGAASDSGVPLQERFDDAEGGPSGTTPLPEQVLEAASVEGLPGWLNPFWKHLCELRGIHEHDISGVRNQLEAVQRTHDRLSEYSKRLRGVEENINSTDHKIDELVKTSQEMSARLETIEANIKTQGERLGKMEIDLARAVLARHLSESGAPPQARPDSSSQGAVNPVGGVTTAQNQSTSFWPGSVAPPRTLPEIGAALGTAPSAGQPAAAQDNSKPKAEESWSTSLNPRQVQMGPYVPMLDPVVTMIKPFERMVDYLRFRLKDMTEQASDEDLNHLVKIKERAANNHHALKNIDGSDPIRLLEFLSVFKRAMDNMGKNEGVAVRIVSYFLEDEMESAYDSHMTTDCAATDGQDTTTWPYVVHMLIDTFITDDILQEAYDEATRARQQDDEAVDRYFLRVSDLTGRCHGVFSQAEIANLVLVGMKSSIRQRIQHAVDSMSPHERSSLPKIRKLAMREDKAQKDQAREHSASAAKSPKKAGRKAVQTLHISANEGDYPPSPPSSISTRAPTMPPEMRPANRAHDPIDMVNSAAHMTYLFVITESEVQKAIEHNKLDPTRIMQSMQDLPNITSDQLDQALSVIPQDYWRLSCWTCREKGHVTFVCPYLTMQQRVFFTYCYYMHQVQTNPELKAWYQKKIAYYRGEGPEPSPKPGSQQYGGGGSGYGRGRGRGRGRGYDRRYDGSYYHATPQPALPAPTPAAGALPAPPVAAPNILKRPEDKPVAHVQHTQENSSDSSENE